MNDWSDPDYGPQWDYYDGPTPIKVPITWTEVHIGALGGVRRRIDNIIKGSEEHFRKHPKATWDPDINGCLAEVVTAKHYGQFWSPNNGIFGPDVGRTHVRSKVMKGHRLVIHAEDLANYPDQIFLSVLVDFPECWLCGWYWSTPAILDTDWIIHKPGVPNRYFVPNNKLFSMDDLPMEAFE